MRRLLVPIGIVAVILISAVLLRPFLAGNAGDLKVGDCFSLPSSSSSPSSPAGTVTDVQRHACSDDHAGEVIFVGTMTGSDDAYPTEDVFFEYVNTNCVPVFRSYTSLDFASQSTLDIGWLSPTQDAWKSGERGVTCYAYRVDETTTKGTLRKS